MLPDLTKRQAGPRARCFQWERVDVEHCPAPDLHISREEHQCVEITVQDVDSDHLG